MRWEALPGGHDVELPRIDYGRRNTRDYGYAYFAGWGEESDWIDRLVKVDVRDGGRSEWSAPGCYPGEPIFVREPGNETEDGGVILSVVLDGRRALVPARPRRRLVRGAGAPRPRTTSRSAFTAST